jgi:hypothetical protein
MAPDRSRPTAPLALALVVIVAVTMLAALGRPPICTCGTIALWGEVGPRQSQMLADWYSASHIVHGFLFFALLRLAVPSWPIEWRFLVALLVEAAWEIVENTPLVIDRYREATIALGYSGDSIVNSVSDIVMMALGLLAARRLPWRASLAVVATLELVPLFAIRDNLTLNVLMLVAPNDAVRVWQAG